jgi:hypothetical protein
MVIADCAGVAVSGGLDLAARSVAAGVGAVAMDVSRFHGDHRNALI